MKRTLLALTLLAAPAAALAVPAQLTTQGRILDSDDAPVEDTLEVTFRLMDSETGGNTLWEEAQPVTFTNGFYAVMLGADEEANPLEDSVLDQWPLYLEVQLDGEPAMAPRMAMGSVPYARQAGVAEELAAGADIDAGSLTVNGTEVVTADGEWSGATPDVDWSELTGIPGDFADEDDADTLAGLVCSDGQWAVWDDDSAAWGCDGFSDTTLLDADVVVAVGTDVVDLYAGSTMDGYTLLTEDSELAWANLTGVPSGLDDGDDDTLATLSCTDGQIAVYDTGAVAWICGTDTDNMLTATEVVDAVQAAAALALPDATTVGGDAVITTTDTVAWSQLSSVPTGLSDGDDDTLGALSCSGDAIPVYSGSAWTCGTDTDNTLTPTEVVDAVNAAAAVAMTGTLSVGGYAVLTENSSLDWSKLTGVPTGLADGDDDTLAGLGCADGEVATYDSSTGWGCSDAGSLSSDRPSIDFVGRYGESDYLVSHRSDGLASYDPERSWMTYMEDTPLDAFKTLYIDSSGTAHVAGDSVSISGSWLRISSDGEHLISTTGAAYEVDTSTGTTTSSSSYGTSAYSDVIFDVFNQSHSCSVSFTSGSITCLDNRPSTPGYPTPPSGAFERVVADAQECYSSGAGCTGYVCGITAAGMISCTDRWAYGSISVPSGITHGGRVWRRDHGDTRVATCGLTVDNDLVCDVHQNTGTGSAPIFTSCTVEIPSLDISYYAIYSAWVTSSTDCSLNYCAATTAGEWFCNQGQEI